VEAGGRGCRKGKNGERGEKRKRLKKETWGHYFIPSEMRSLLALAFAALVASAAAAAGDVTALQIGVKVREGEKWRGAEENARETLENEESTCVATRQRSPASSCLARIGGARQGN